MPMTKADLEVITEKAKAIFGNHIVVVPEARMVTVVAGGRYYCLDDDSDSFRTYFPYFVRQGDEVRVTGLQMGTLSIRTPADIEPAWAAAAANATIAVAGTS